MIFDLAKDRLRGLARRAGPVLASVEGRPGLSPLPFVLEATQSFRRVVFEPPGLSDRANLAAFAEQVRPLVSDARAASPRRRTDVWNLPAWDPWSSAPAASALPREWPGLLALLPRSAPLTLVINEPDGLAAVNRRFWRLLGDAWLAARRRGQRVHVFLVRAERGLGRRLNAPGSPFREPSAALGSRPVADPAEVMEVGVGSHYDLASAFPEWRGRHLLLGWALFGGLPSTWAAVRSVAEPNANPPFGPADALRACLARADSPLASAPRDRLERRVQKVSRYASILSAVAQGAASWGQVSAALGASAPGAAGPYLHRLRRLGLIDAERPLGASRSGRRTRYRLADPFEALWWSALHPLRSALLTPGGAERAWADRLEPALQAVLAAALPAICRNFLRFGCGALLGATARRAGPLWGDDFDFPAAATLENGAVCHAHVHAGPGPVESSALEALEGEVRRCPYGRGRQSRFRLLVSLGGFAEPLRREAARNPLVRLVGAEVLGAPPTSVAPEVLRSTRGA